MNLEKELNELSHMWTTDKQKWVLLRSESEPSNQDKLQAFNLDNSTVLLIESEELNRSVTKRMKQNGIPIMTTQEALKLRHK